MLTTLQQKTTLFYLIACLNFEFTFKNRLTQILHVDFVLQTESYFFTQITRIRMFLVIKSGMFMPLKFEKIND